MAYDRSMAGKRREKKRAANYRCGKKRSAWGFTDAALRCKEHDKKKHSKLKTTRNMLGVHLRPNTLQYL